MEVQIVLIIYSLVSGTDTGGTTDSFKYKPMVELGSTVEFTGAGNGTSGSPYVITRASEGSQYIVVNQ